MRPAYPGCLLALWQQCLLLVGHRRNFRWSNVGRQIWRSVGRPAAALFDHAPMDPLVDVLLVRVVSIEEVAMADGDRRQNGPIVRKIVIEQPTPLRGIHHPAADVWRGV